MTEGVSMNVDGESLDVVVVGGGPAGLTAALYLGRARKNVLVLDHGDPRHAVSAGVHNFLTRDGMPPSELREAAWRQMAAYPSVDRRTAVVTGLKRHGAQWRVRVEDGVDLRARAVLLATGVVDEHPDLPGFRERWGRSIHQCPFCHGWELRGRPLAVLAAGEAAGHLAPLLRSWTDDVVLLTHGQDLPEEIRQRVEAAGISIYEAPVVALEGPGRELERVRLADGTVLRRRGLFVSSPQRQVELVRQLGLPLTEEGYVEVDPSGAAPLPMMWAAGDLTTRAQQVVEAAAQGARAAAAIVRSLHAG